MHYSRLWSTITTPGLELRVLDVMKSSLWLIGMTMNHEPKPLDTMNNSRLCLISVTLNHELKALDVMNRLELWLK